ncbi:unnamed protein product [Musa textilis]
MYACMHACLCTHSGRILYLIWYFLTAAAFPLMPFIFATRCFCYSTKTKLRAARPSPEEMLRCRKMKKSPIFPQDENMSFATICSWTPQTCLLCCLASKFSLEAKSKKPSRPCASSSALP